jgi:hypothetical protein
LEQNIVKDGCRDSLVRWQGTNKLIDGHNRYDICKKHNISFNIIDKQFTSLEEVLDWVDENQLSRRNLTDSQRKIILGRRYNSEKKKGFNGNQHTKVAKDNLSTTTTAEKIASISNLDEKTIRRYGKIATKFDAIEAENPVEAKNIFSGKIKLGYVMKGQPKDNPKVNTKKPSPFCDEQYVVPMRAEDVISMIRYARKQMRELQKDLAKATKAFNDFCDSYKATDSTADSTADILKPGYVFEELRPDNKFDSERDRLYKIRTETQTKIDNIKQGLVNDFFELVEADEE